jgi:hypothetical protein
MIEAFNTAISQEKKRMGECIRPFKELGFSIVRVLLATKAGKKLSAELPSAGRHGSVVS